MFNIRKHAFSEKWRNIISAIIYILFVIYSIYLIMHTEEFSSKLFYTCLTVILISVVALSEYLRILYRQAIKTLVMDCDPYKAQEIEQKLLKYDIFKAYKKTMIIFDLMVYTDLNQYDKCIELLDNNEKFFKQSLDNLLIRNYNYFKGYIGLDNKTKAKKYYQDTIKLKGAKIKGSKISPLYSWEEIDAVYYLCIKDIKKSKAAFANTNTQMMNHRELSHFYFDYAQLNLLDNDYDAACEHLNRVLEISNKNALYDLADQQLKELKKDEKAQNHR